MKITFTFIFAVSVFTSFAQASYTPVDVPADTLQALPSTTPALITTSQDTARKEVFRKNIIKVNLSSFLLYNNSISYERSLTRKISFVVGYRYMPQTTANSSYLVRKAVDKYGEGDEELENDVNSTLIGNSAFTGEVRFYSGQHPGARGFYLSLYGRYMNLSAAFPQKYETESRIYTIPYDGKIKGFAGGAMIGAQWLIAKRVTFDWYILGGHYGKLKVDMPAVTDLTTMTSEEKRGLKEDIEDTNGDLKDKTDLEATVTNNGVSVKGTAPFVGLRGFGFSLGLAF
ncbi:DUF3575 domain-containing protein [Pontibacter roseus]|uniref:DUF3575 domain-containing protein n=1 Tax=Pontibacter roseus TaxID=336989 RepID=UPI00039EADEB|nr:DUF3575 domain-containing protein [Pontibacter roseus]